MNVTYFRPIDQYIIDEIYASRVYDNILPPTIEAPNIIDLGANIGVAALWFFTYYSNAKIFCIEPDKENFELLQRNIEPIVPLIRAERYAVHSFHDKMALISPSYDDRPCAYQTISVPEEQSTVDGLPIESILKMSKFDTIDLLKVDIEGAEERLFLNGDLDWLTPVQHVVVEIHFGQHLVPIMRALTNSHFTVSWREQSRLVVGHAMRS